MNECLTTPQHGYWVSEHTRGDVLASALPDGLSDQELHLHVAFN